VANILSIVFASIIFFVPSKKINKLLCIKHEREEMTESYEDLRKTFDTEYDRENPIT